MLIAKRGAQVALERARQLAVPSSRTVLAQVADTGPLDGAEPPQLWECGRYASLGRIFEAEGLGGGGASAGGG